MRPRASLGLLVALAALLFPAAASADHLYEESFGPDGTEATAFSGESGSRSVAIDQANGTIYVGNRGTESIYKFDEAHQPASFSALGSNQITGVPTRPAAGRSQLAVDPATHRIYVTSGASNNSLRAFEASGAPAEFSALASSEINGFEGLCGVAVDSSGDIYAADREAEEVSVYAPSGAKLASFEVGTVPGVEEKEPHETGPCNLAVDSAGNVYVTHSRRLVEKFTPTAFPVTGATTYSSAGTFDPGQDYTVTVNPANGHIYVLRALGEFGTIAGLTEIVEYDAAGVEVPSPSGAVEPGQLHIAAGIAARGSGLAERIYASDVAFKGQQRVEVFGPLVVPPEVSTGKASKVKKTTATVEGTLDPKGLQVTSCNFEYATEAQYEPKALNPYAAAQSAPCDSLDGAPISVPGEIPADESDHLAGAALSGLAPNTTYHFRFAAANATAGDKGKDETFKTFGPPLISKEVVSEVSTDSALVSGSIDPRGEATTFAVEYVTQAQFEATGYASATTVPVPAEEIGSGVGPVEVSQELLGLTPETAYRARILADNSVDPPVHGQDLSFATFAVSGGLPDGRAYEMVSPPFKSGEVYAPESFGALSGSCLACLPGWDGTKMPMQPSPDGNSIAYEGQPFGPGTAPEANEYLADRGAGGWATEAISGPEYLANATLPGIQDSGYRAFSRDLSRAVIFQAKPSLSPQAPPDYSNLYLWQRGAALEPLLTEAPPNRLAGEDPTASLILVYAGANAGSASAPAFTHVVFEANDALTPEAPGLAPAAPEVTASERNLYEWSSGELHLLNVLPGNAAVAPDAVIGAGRLISPNPTGEGPDFAHAISDDGSRVFWTAKSSKRTYVRVNAEETREIPDPGTYLTASTDGSRVLLNNGHLYDADPSLPTQIADLSAGEGGFKGILGQSEDLSRIYFVDSAVLAGESPEHKSPVAAQNNLYLWEAGATSFIAALAPKDNEFGQQSKVGDWRPSPSFRTTRVSPDGRYLAFMSRASLSGYDNNRRGGKDCIAGGGATACTEVFEFDAVAAKLSCASCNPTGERPLRFSNLPLIAYEAKSTFLEEPESLTANGRLFFESQDNLTAADENGGIQDVYEFEPHGVGSCTRVDGCVSLISSGKDSSDSHFLGATPSGNDAFIVTREQLLPRDTDDFLDLYDARVGGSFNENTTPPCGGEACRGALPPAPNQQSPGSASFKGPGNEAQKQKKHKKKRKHKKHAKKRAAKHDRGGSK